MARKLWGRPNSIDQITEIFRRHVLGQLAAVPWSDDIDTNITAPDSATPSTDSSSALRAETDVIRSNLLSLITAKGYWTLASQPAVDGASSSDPVFGWGPKDTGFVFQKAFVEFFCSRAEWEERLRPLLTEHGREVVGWMKTDAHESFESSELLAQQDQKTSGHNRSNGVNTERTNPASKMNANTSTADVNIVNAVTWGVFPAREILTPTIIEAESFRAWAQEAYAIWNEWKRCFPRGSDEAKFLEKAAAGYVLVNVVGQDFRGGHQGDGGRLWRILLGEDEDGKS